jgi:ABC-type oligopeptide transport system substrate-binding subunit
VRRPDESVRVARPRDVRGDLLARDAVLRERGVELLRRAEAILLAEAPVIPLYHVPMRRFHAASVRGWHENLLDLHPLKFVSLAP